MITLAIETSCDETAVAVLGRDGGLLSSVIASQADLHRVYGGVVPEVASRNHLVKMRPVLLKALDQAGLTLEEVEVFAATSGPGLAGALLVGNTTAKTLALAHGRPFVAVNHLEGHLLSPYLGDGDGIRPAVALVVSGGHTLLIHLRSFADYHLHGKTRDDAAGEAFDKVAKMLGLPYPGGPEIDRLAVKGDASRFDFPRSMLNRPGYDFSFSGLKTAVLYTLGKMDGATRQTAQEDLCASFQEAVIEVLVGKTLRLAKVLGETVVTVSGGVSCNTRLRAVFAEETKKRGLELLLASPALSTDNAAMIAFVGREKALRGDFSPLDQDVDPNLRLAEGSAP